MKDDYVTRTMFIWVVGILFVAIGSLWTYYFARGEALMIMGKDIATIKTDVSWIKGALERNNEVAIR